MRGSAMTTRLPPVDVVLVGFGWTGAIMAQELTDAGLQVLAIERGGWRDTPTDFPTTHAPDELRYYWRHEMFLETARETQTFRNNRNQTALPIRRWGSYLPGAGVGRRGGALERADVPVPAVGPQGEVAQRGALRRDAARGDDGPGLSADLRRARGGLRLLREDLRHLGAGGQHPRRDPGGGQPLRGLAVGRVPQPAAGDDLLAGPVRGLGAGDGAPSLSRRRRRT
jgi:hypothetical protein